MNPLHNGDAEGRSAVSVNSDDAKRSYLGNYFYITQPWSLEYYLTVRGSENFHIYLWIAKDLAWTQDSYWPSMIFGSLALAWCGVLAFNAVSHRSIDECYMLIALTMWLAANFLWMAGMAYEMWLFHFLIVLYLGEVFNDDDGYVVPRTAIIMEVFSLLYDLFIKLILCHVVRYCMDFILSCYFTTF